MNGWTDGQTTDRQTDKQTDRLMDKWTDGQSDGFVDHWLTICVRIFSLLEQILSRLEEENGGVLVVATLCFLECSRHGLLESELLRLLGDEDNLLPPDGTWQDLEEVP